jgi:hypothetical protein
MSRSGKVLRVLFEKTTLARQTSFMRYGWCWTVTSAPNAAAYSLKI